MATKSIAWTTGGGTITLTYLGQGDGSIQVDSDANTLGSARSQVVTVKTGLGGVVTKNLTVRQGACPFPVGEVRNFSYTGDVQSVLLPAGSYKLQCWGAQGGSNDANSTYGITEKAGGKGGYSEGVLTISSPTTVYIFVGGQGGPSGDGGWNGGGGCPGSSSYDSGDTLGVSMFACGGGGTDIALVTSTMSYFNHRTNRSLASLLSRIIVAGGGSGGAMAYQKVRNTTTSWETIGTIDLTASSDTFNGYSWSRNIATSGTTRYHQYNFELGINPIPDGTYVRLLFNNTPSGSIQRVYWTGNGQGHVVQDDTSASTITYTHVDYSTFSGVQTRFRVQVETKNNTNISGSVTIQKQVSSTAVTENRDSHVGWAGGGTTGDGYVDKYKGKQNAAGNGGGDFGLGANNNATNYRYCAGAGGGGWYGGGADINNNSLYMVKASGGGSGFVNTSDNASYRPTGYTGLQLDSGETMDGNTSFPAPGGGTETGHEGNGYARITRLA